MHRQIALASLIFAASVSNSAKAQCGGWTTGFQAPGVNERVDALVASAVGPDVGASLYVGGEFTSTSGTPANHIARWDGVAWHPLGSGVAGSWHPYVDVTVDALLVSDFESSPRLYAGGNFVTAGGVTVNHVARWNGAAWSALGVGFDLPVRALAVFDDGSGAALYAGGEFTSSGGATIYCIARWDGANWQPLGSGIPGPAVNALAVFDDGSGPALYVAGSFLTAGGGNAAYFARWDGVSWSEVGNGLSGRATTLAVFDDGNGPALFVGGQFTHASATPVYSIARWSGTAYSALGSGVDNFVNALTVYDDGSGGGPALIVGGRFEHAGSLPVQRIAKWSGSSWSALGSVDAAVLELAVFDDPTTPWPELFAGGRFDSASGISSPNFARYANACACQATSYCTAGTTSSGCVPAISGAGAASASLANTFSVQIANVEGQKQGHIAYSITGPNANPWGPSSSSFLCIKAPTQRTPTQNSGGTAGACDGVMTLDWNAFVSANSPVLGSPFAAGAEIWMQGYFRDPPAPETTNLSNGLRFRVCP